MKAEARGAAFDHRRVWSARVRQGGLGRQAAWYEEGVFGRIASERGGSLTVNGGIRDNVIATGAAGDHGSGQSRRPEADAPSIGFNITPPQEQEPNAYLTPELTFRFPLLRDAQDEPGHARQRARGLPRGVRHSTSCSRS